MNVRFLTIGNRDCPSSRYRGYYLAEILKNKGMHTQVIPLGSKKNLLTIIGEFLISFLSKGKIIFVQKLDHILIFYLVLSYKLNNKIIFDFDDSIFLLNPEKVIKMLKVADLVIAGNNYLANYAKKYNSKVLIMPTSISIDQIGIYKIHRYRENKIIGWIGTKSNLKYLKLLKKPLENLSKKYRLELRIIGPVNCDNLLPKIKGVEQKFIPWKLESEWEELAKCDIGVMPLSNDKWARGKCGFKLIQYMAVGIPAVGSAIGMNNKIIKNGKNGFLCKKEIDWENSLNKLIVSVKLRKKLGDGGRKTVAKYYNLEKNSKRLLKILKAKAFLNQTKINFP